MVLGEVGYWIARLERQRPEIGRSVVVEYDAIKDSARYYLESLEVVNSRHIQMLVDEINSNEYPGLSIWERPDGRWTLERDILVS